MALVGVQPVLMQVPPKCSFSISATLQPRSARLCASGLPPWPEPMIIASYFIVDPLPSPTARAVELLSPVACIIVACIIIARSNQQAWVATVGDFSNRGLVPRLRAHG